MYWTVVACRATHPRTVTDQRAVLAYAAWGLRVLLSVTCIFRLRVMQSPQVSLWGQAWVEMCRAVGCMSLGDELASACAEEIGMAHLQVETAPKVPHSVAPSY